MYLSGGKASLGSIKYIDLEPAAIDFSVHLHLAELDKPSWK